MAERTGAPPDTVNPDHPVEDDAVLGFTWDQLLYRLYGDADELLYIGRTNNIANRFKQHAKAQPWWHEVRRSAVETLSSFDALCAAEKAAIVDERPRYNIVHAVDKPPRSSRQTVTAGPWRGLNAHLDGMADLLHEAECLMRPESNVRPEVPACDDCASVSWACLKMRDEAVGGVGPGLDAAAKFLPRGVEKFKLWAEAADAYRLRRSERLREQGQPVEPVELAEASGAPF